MMHFVAGLAAGLLASVHCAVMCGPLVVVAQNVTRRRAVYHVARVAAYVGCGMVAGGIGQTLAFSGLAATLAFGTAAALLLHVVVTLWSRRRNPVLAGPAAAITTVLGRAGAATASYVRSHRLLGSALLGVLNGLLPCGLVYAALATAAGLADTVSSALLMLGFGLGTTPVLAVIGQTARSASPTALRRWRGLAPAALLIMAAVLIVRGLSLGDAAAMAHRH
jgi:sulfite exporter TauE/SafE